MSTKAKVLVTGASGYIAGHCVRELLENGYSVRGTVRSLRTSNVEHLRAIAQRTRGQLDFVEADLTTDAGWRQAVDGCTYVQHVASPFPAHRPTDENELVRPAVDGTRRVLEACANTNGAVKRVVLTSSVAAVAFGHPRSDKVYVERDWTNLEIAEP
jgi:dihydroflavonol-4-reductase